MPKIITFMVIFLLLGGCATQPNTENAIRIIALGEGDRVPNTEFENLMGSNDFSREFRERGIVYEFQAGDTIQMAIEIEGNLTELIQTQPIDIKLKRNLWLFTNGNGWWASLDGIEFHKYKKFIDGKLGISLGIAKEKMLNDLKIQFVLNSAG
jgi:hypothetical protein